MEAGAGRVDLVKDYEPMVGDLLVRYDGEYAGYTSVRRVSDGSAWVDLDNRDGVPVHSLIRSGWRFACRGAVTLAEREALGIAPTEDRDTRSEVERLRADIDALNRELDVLVPRVHQYEDEVGQCWTAVGREREDDPMGLAKAVSETIRELRAEVERLRAHFERFRDSELGKYEDARQRDLATIRDLQAQLARAESHSMTMLEADPLDPVTPIETVDAQLRAMGHDPKAVAERGRAIAKTARKAAELEGGRVMNHCDICQRIVPRTQRMRDGYACYACALAWRTGYATALGDTMSEHYPEPDAGASPDDIAHEMQALEGGE